MRLVPFDESRLKKFKGIIAEQADSDLDTPEFFEFADEIRIPMNRVLEKLGHNLSSPQVTARRPRIERVLFEWVAREPGGASLINDGMIQTLCERLLPKPKLH